jgi:hypothetical protein
MPGGDCSADWRIGVGEELDWSSRSSSTALMSNVAMLNRLCGPTYRGGGRISAECRTRG